MAIPVSRGGIDYPDFNASLMLGDSASDVGLSEVAVRLNSGISYSRGGNVIFQESFERGFGNWKRLGSDELCTPTLVTHPVESGYYCARLQSSPDIDWTSWITRYLAIAISSTFGITFSFSNKTTIQEFRVYYYLLTSEKSLTIRLKLSTNDNILWLKDNQNKWQNLGQHFLDVYNVEMFHHCKTVIIPSTNSLRYVSINETIFDTTGIILPQGAGSNWGLMFIQYLITGYKQYQEQMLIDNIYVSINE